MTRELDAMIAQVRNLKALVRRGSFAPWQLNILSGELDALRREVGRVNCARTLEARRLKREA